MIKIHYDHKVQPGQRYGRLTVLGYVFGIRAPAGRIRTQAVCLCDCGKVCCPRCDQLLDGNSSSCGCLSVDTAIATHTRHGLSGQRLHPLYTMRTNMLGRCHNPNHQAYRHYGGRGILVCDEWRHSPEAFVAWALISGYRPGLQIDRIDNDSGYRPNNCHFVTIKENCRNRRNNKLLSAWGDVKPLAAWADDPRCVVCGDTLGSRIDKGQDPETAMATATLPKKDYGRNRQGNRHLRIFEEVKLLIDWARDPRCAVLEGTFKSRIQKGWDPEEAFTRAACGGQRRKVL